MRKELIQLNIRETAIDEKSHTKAYELVDT